MDVPLTHKQEELIRYALPESVGVTFYACECAVVFFPDRGAMLRTWTAGTPDTIGGVIVGYMALDELVTRAGRFDKCISLRTRSSGIAWLLGVIFVSAYTFIFIEESHDVFQDSTWNE